MNLLAQAHSQLNADTLSPLAEHLGLESAQMPQLAQEAIPALFAIFQKACANPDKSALVTQFLKETDSSILSDPADALSQYGSDLTRGGKSGLARLLGPQLTDYIAPLAKSTGLGEGKIASALGTLAPFVIALMGQQTQDASELNTLLGQQEINAPQPDQKIASKEEQSEKSYLPDPDKKRDRRPFPKRKAILLILILALVAALLFWLVSTGKIPLGTAPAVEDEATSLLPFSQQVAPLSCYENHLS